MDTAFNRYSIDELDLLRDTDSQSYDHLTRLASSSLGVPVSLISIIDKVRDRQFFKSMHGLKEPWAGRRQTPLSHSFCQHVVADDAPFVVSNALDHPRVKDNLAIRDLDVIAYIGVPVHDPQGQPVGALCAIESRERVWTDGELRLLHNIALCVEDAIRLKSALVTSEAQRTEQAEFTYAVSHDIRGPIRTLRMLVGELQMLAKFGKLDEHEKVAEAAHKVARRMQNISDDILSYAQTLQRVSDFEPVDLKALIEDIEADLRSQISEARAKLNVEDLPMIEGSPAQVRMLFQNLIANALKFRSIERQPVITIGSQVADHVTRVTISDNGIGIAAQYHDRIFRLFERLHPQSSYEGTGLGLALCARIVGFMNGTISVESVEGEGSTFIITLPNPTLTGSVSS